MNIGTGAALESQRKDLMVVPDNEYRDGYRSGMPEKRFNGGYSEGVPPLTIPNREVKPLSADGTITMGE